MVEAVFAEVRCEVLWAIPAEFAEAPIPRSPSAAYLIDPLFRAFSSQLVRQLVAHVLCVASYPLDADIACLPRALPKVGHDVSNDRVSSTSRSVADDVHCVPGVRVDDDGLFRFNQRLRLVELCK